MDALAVETLLGGLAVEMPFALEIAGDANGRRFLIRAPRDTLAHIERQIQAVYEQVAFPMVPPERDPAAPSDLPTYAAELTLRRPVYLPLRTFRDGEFREADPIRGLLGAFSGLNANERVLAQIVLFPAPPHWADRFQGSARRLDQQFAGEAPTPQMIVRQIISLFAVIVVSGLIIWAALAYLQHAWLTCVFASALGGLGLIGVTAFTALFMAQTNVDPALVQRKTTAPAYDAALRLRVVAQTPDRARARLRELAGAYRQFNLSSGNAFVARRAEFEPRELALPRWTGWQELLGQVMRLNTSELASLWHLPVGESAPMVSHTMTRRLLPSRPELVAEGIAIGNSTHEGQTFPVRLPTQALQRHSFLVAKTQKGKSTLMAHLAAAVMQSNAALIAIDPHGDLARSLRGLVPRTRVADVIDIDFAETQQVVGLNLLDTTQGRSADQIVSNIIHVGELIWADYWGPRMEDALRIALRTLITANEQLVQRGARQFTLLDIPPLYELPRFRHKLIDEFIKDFEIERWWQGYYDTMDQKFRMEVINPVLTKIHRFSTHSVVRNIVGQSTSTVNFRQLLNERRILLVNTATGVLGPDAGGLLGAVLMDYMNFAVREQMAIPDPEARARVVVIVDEFQSIPGVDYPGLLAELQKMGASFILATQALGQLDALNRVLRPAIMSNIANLFVFQTSAEDADLLRHELDDAVTATDIINLPDHSLYLKTQSGKERLPVMYVETLSPPKSDAQTIARVRAQMERYARPALLVERERAEAQLEWYGRESSILKAALTADEAVGLRRRNPDDVKADESKRALVDTTPNPDFLTKNDDPNPFATERANTAAALALAQPRPDATPTAIETHAPASASTNSASNSTPSTAPRAEKNWSGDEPSDRRRRRRKKDTSWSPHR